MTGSIAKILKRMRVNPENVSYSDLCKVCEHGDQTNKIN
jgi:hypothetical protein